MSASPRHGCALHRFRAGVRANLQETAKRGLIFVDDGANPRSVAARIAGGSNLPGRGSLQSCK